MEVTRKYKEELKKLDRLPKEKITQIYIIPSKMYNGFYGKNGYRSFDFIVGDKEIYGWFHWEGDVINLINKEDYGMTIDSGENMFIRLYNSRGFNIEGIDISCLTITSNNKYLKSQLYQDICIVEELIEVKNIMNMKEIIRF